MGDKNLAVGIFLVGVGNEQIFSYWGGLRPIGKTLFYGDVQCTISVSNICLGPLNISTKYTLIFSLYLEPLYLEVLSIWNKHFRPIATILSLSRTLYLHVL